ncbi:hypothetical protein SELMODRAFT_443353 [Selaginella moellendorffii]|uniref:RING-type domain-containing protein n=2 Tax=Selaginella moellendorffii TaxID=88036 RepID=D8S0M9_SELML|nr:hypothetical protein SELMODRAFT_443353 [Selaginella moellendorffii]
MSSDRRRSSYIWWYDKSLNFFRDRSAKQELTTRSSKTLTDLDCCSVCQEQFTLPCQANCTHWFCGECILRVWEYGSALLPCKCPICRQPITHLWPSEFSTTEEATNFMPLLTDIATYNLNFDSRVITILRLKFPDTEVRCLHVLHFLFLLVLALYVVCTLNLILEGKLAIRTVKKEFMELNAAHRWVAGFNVAEGKSGLRVLCSTRSLPRLPIMRGRKLGREAILTVQSLKRAKGVREEMEQVLKSQVSRLLKTDMLEVLRELHRQNDCVLAYEELQGEMLPDGLVYTELMTAYLRCERPNDAIDTFQEMKQLGLTVELKTFTTLAKWLEKKGLGEEASAGMQRSRRVAQQGFKALSGFRVFKEDSSSLWHWQQRRGLKIDGSEVRVGQILERKGRLVQVIKIAHAHGGRGGATIPIEYKDLISGIKSTERLRTSESVERVAVDSKTFTYLYDEGQMAILMDPKTFDQVTVDKELFGTGASYLSDGMSVTVQMHEGKPVTASVPVSLTCKVVEAEPFMKGQTQAAAYKHITLENGKIIMAPCFIVSGDQIVVNTVEDTYVTRASKE